MNQPDGQIAIQEADAANEARWEMILAREAPTEAGFVYAVKTTGVYCRPGCASRRPRRENVAFYVGAKEAREAGFRACLRCRPDEARTDPLAEVIVRACRAIEAAETPPALAALAAAAGLSPFHFQRRFKAAVGLTPAAYARARRAERLRTNLASQAGITEAIYEAGFNSSGRFYETSRESLGMTPSAFKNNGLGEAIRYAVAECWLGKALAAATERGICAIALGDDADLLLADLKTRFHKAELVPAGPDFEQTLQQVLALIEAPAAPFDLPLDIRAGAFQQRVWQALTRIPPGATASYADVAEAIGAPTAARAVARACAANPLALAIPCHRVVRADGSLSGYRWGVERKCALLLREKQSRR
jgi:AraC family transcriptional regulator of adaptative response/methylated-DNA-[protein]-cysteine methyltransferase